MAWTLGALFHAVLDVLYFRNPNAVTFLYVLMGLATIGTLALATALRTGTHSGRLAEYVARITPCYPYLLLQAGLTLAVSIEHSLEHAVTEWLGWDFTPLIYRMEGNLVERIQAYFHYSFAGPTLDLFFPLVYSWLALLITMGPFLYFAFTGRVRSARRLAVTALFVWSVGLLFYLFMPVNEVWVTAGPPYEYGEPLYLLGSASPSLEEAFIVNININNNFPSLHVATTSAVAFALYQARERTLFRFVAPAATLVALSTVYLGIHWIVDIIAGLALAWGASVAYDVWDRRSPRRTRSPTRALVAAVSTSSVAAASTEPASEAHPAEERE